MNTTDHPRLSLAYSSPTTLALSSSIPPSLRPSRPLPSTDPISTRIPPPPPAPLRITRKKPVPMEVMTLPFIIADPSPALNNTASSPQRTTIQPPNTASTSASMFGGESSTYLPTPPLSDATSSPPLTSDRPASVEDMFRPENVQFGPRPARNSKKASSSLFSEQRRGVQIAYAEEFGVPNASYPVVSVPRSQSVADDSHPPADVSSSPTSSLPNPYPTSLSRTLTASSVSSRSSSVEFGPRPRPKRKLTLNLPISNPTVPITCIAITDADASLPNPYQPQGNPQSYFSPHTPEHPPNRGSLIQTGGASSVSADVGTEFGVSHFSPHTPATTSLLSSLGTGNTATIGTGPNSTKTERQADKGAGGRASGFLAPPPSAAIGSYWSPHTPDTPESLESAMDKAVVEELVDISVKETEFLKVDNAPHSHTPTTDATDGHSVEPSSTSPHDPSPHSSSDVFTDSDSTASDSSSPLGNRGLVSSKLSKPQLTLQTWDLDKMREEKKRQESTADRRQRSREKDARNRKGKGRGGIWQKEAETIVQTTEAIKGENIPPLPKPGGVPVARTPRIPQQGVGSEHSLLPAALRPGSQLFQTLPPAQLALRSQPVLDMPQPATQGTNTGVSLAQNRRSVATTNAWRLTLSATPELPLTLNTNSLSLGTKSNSDRDWFAHGQSPSEPTVPDVNVLSPGGTQVAEPGKKGIAKEKRRSGFFVTAGGKASDTNLTGFAASSAKKSKDDKDVNDLRENRKSAFYSRGINASFEALVGWGGKIFSSSSTSVNTYGQSSKKGEKDDKASYPVAVPPTATAQPHPYAQYQTPRPFTLPLIDTQHQRTPPLHPPAPNTRVYASPMYPHGERGPSFEDLGVETGWVGKGNMHTPHTHSGRGHGATGQATAAVADAQPAKKGHSKNSSSGVSGFVKMFGFGKKDKDKGKQKWV